MLRTVLRRIEPELDAVDQDPVDAARLAELMKQPFYLHPKDADQVLPLAGLYEFWRDKDKQSDDPDAWLITLTIITTNATDDVGNTHDRMPMTVRPEDWAAWLDPRVNKVDNRVVRGLMAIRHWAASTSTRSAPRSTT